MNKHQFEGAWHELKGKVKKYWGQLTDDDISQMSGRTEELAGALQRKYGYTKEEAKKEVDSFLNSVKSNDNSND